jgi:hypothetical protein
MFQLFRYLRLLNLRGVLQTQFQLALSHFQSAWVSLGMAGRLGQLLGLHTAHDNLPYHENQSRRRVFWSMFMLDRSVSFQMSEAKSACCDLSYSDTYAHNNTDTCP